MENRSLRRRCRFDKFVWNEFGRPKGRPRSAQRAGVSPMDGASNPLLCDSSAPSWGVFRIWRRERGQENRRARRARRLTQGVPPPFALRAIGSADVRSGILPSKSSGTNLDDRRSAPERVARRGEPPWMGRTIPRCGITAPLARCLLYLTKERRDECQFLWHPGQCKKRLTQACSIRIIPRLRRWHERHAQ